MKLQTKYFINGLICLILGLLCITYLPYIVRDLFIKIQIQNYIFVQLELFLLIACSIFYLFSPKYYTKQILSFVLGYVYYLFFIKVLVNYL